MKKEQHEEKPGASTKRRLKQSVEKKRGKEKLGPR
jgi:hypothetical protein